MFALVYCGLCWWFPFEIYFGVFDSSIRHVPMFGLRVLSTFPSCILFYYGLNEWSFWNEIWRYVSMLWLTFDLFASQHPQAIWDHCWAKAKHMKQRSRQWVQGRHANLNRDICYFLWGFISFVSVYKQLENHAKEIYGPCSLISVPPMCTVAFYWKTPPWPIKLLKL